MKELLAKYGERLRYVKYHPSNPIQTWVLGIRGESTEVDGRQKKERDIKIYSTTFEGLLE